MTILVQQKGPSDCALACIAMAAGKTWEELWNAEDIATTVDNRGCSYGDDLHGYLQRAGFDKSQYRFAHLYDRGDGRKLLWGRRACLTVDSLNIEDSKHMVYWDGEQLFDPSPRRTYQFLSSVYTSSLILYK